MAAVPRPDSCEAEDVFSRHVHMKYIYALHIYVDIRGWPHRSQADTQSTDVSIGSTHSLILLPSLGASPQVRIYTDICARWIPPAAGLRLSPVAGPGSQSSQLLLPGHTSPKDGDLLQLLV